MKNLIFTYGTLMEGQIAHNTFTEMVFFANGILKDYGLYEVGNYPAACPVKGFNVYGELYEINEELLNKLDRYENEGTLYKRRLVEIEVGPKIFDAWFYEYNMDVSNLELRAPIGKWNRNRNPISNYAWYVCYGSNLLRKRFDCYLKATNASVYAEKPYIINGEIYFAKQSSKWEGKGICFLDLSKKDRKAYGWAYLVDKEKIYAISDEEGSTWYPVQLLGKDENGIEAYTVTGVERYQDNKPGTKYLTVIANGLNEKYGLTQNQIRRYLDCNGRLSINGEILDEIINNL